MLESLLSFFNDPLWMGLISGIITVVMFVLAALGIFSPISQEAVNPTTLV